MTEFVDCPARIDGENFIHENHAACGLPAEVQSRYTVRSSDGPLECIKIRCPLGHWFNATVSDLTLPVN